jgi:hypothetical protein
MVDRALSMEYDFELLARVCITQMAKFGMSLIVLSTPKDCGERHLDHPERLTMVHALVHNASASFGAGVVRHAAVHYEVKNFQALIAGDVYQETKRVRSALS